MFSRARCGSRWACMLGMSVITHQCVVRASLARDDAAICRRISYSISCLNYCHFLVKASSPMVTGVNRCRHSRRGRKSYTRLCLTRATCCWRRRNASRCLSSTWRNEPRKNDERSATSSRRRKINSDNFLRKHISPASTMIHFIYSLVCQFISPSSTMIHFIYSLVCQFISPSSTMIHFIYSLVCQFISPSSTMIHFIYSLVCQFSCKEVRTFENGQF